MTAHHLDAPDVLTDGAWLPNGRATLQWHDAGQPPLPSRDDLHLLVACPTCRAKVDETCLRGTRTDGYRARGAPHKARLAPRLCRCGALLRWKRKLCDECRDAENRANKRDYMRRFRSTQTPVVERDSRKSPVDSDAKRRPDRANESGLLATVSTRPKGA